MDKKQWLYSWKGLEHLRDCVHELAKKVVETDKLVRENYPSSVATGVICAAIRDPSTVQSKIVTNAASAQIALRDFHSKLVWEYGLEFDFVRKEWAPILDPSLQV